MTITHAVIGDNSGAIKAVWFNQPYIENSLKKGDEIFLSGKVTINKKESSFSSPTFEKADSIEELTHTGRLIPIYPETGGLTSRWIRYILKPILTELGDDIPETLPERIMEDYDLLPIRDALWQIHYPETKEAADDAQKRFSFEELFLIELYVVGERIKLASKKAVSFPFNLNLTKRFVETLPFKLTDGQRKSAYQILKDLEKPSPMNRLLEGDVGSGKTAVAVIAALNVAKKGHQVAFMAPTEILAKQHFKEVSDLLQDFNLNVGLLTGKQDQFRSKKLRNEVIEISRKKLLEKAKGTINEYTGNLEPGLDLLIGTHALIQDKVKFGKLALVILDEQHRFGVEQRSQLVSKQTDLIPHLLSMTATPIPRTLALTIYGDLDLSLIKELPKGRKKIITEIVDPDGRKKVYSFIRKEVKKGRQVFVVCPKIEVKEVTPGKASPWDNVRAAEAEYENLSKNVFPDLGVELLHGKMNPKDKEKIMTDFRRKKFDILVSTSVVEVGVDIPNASVMVIEGAERFGLAQLHQFRGRVGRSKYQSYCFLFTTEPEQTNRRRLRAIVNSEDGFALAQKDLEIRGPGSFMGTRQWGFPDIAMKSLKDISLVERTREEAKKLLSEDPELKNYPLLKDRLKYFRDNVHLE